MDMSIQMVLSEVTGEKVSTKVNSFYLVLVLDYRPRFECLYIPIRISFILIDPFKLIGFYSFEWIH